MKPRTMPCLLVLLAASLAMGQAPSAVVVVSPPGPARAGTIVTVDASASAGDAVDLDTDAPESSYRLDSNGKVAYFFATDPGTYPFRVSVYSVVDGKVRIAKGKAAIVVEAPAPAPPPTPPPPDPVDPDTRPAPGPVNPLPAAYAGPLVVTLVYEPATMTPQLASLKDSVAIPAAFRSAAIPTRYMTLATTVNGQPSPEYARRGLAPIVAQLGGLPVLIFQDPAGKVVHKVAAPADESGVVAAVNALRGAK